MKKQLKFFGLVILAISITVGCSSTLDSNVEDEALKKDDLIMLSNNGKKDKDDSTVVPGHRTDDGSIPDGVVNGKYKALYAFDDNGDWYYDLGDGRIQGTVGSIDDLDQSTLSACDYNVIYRGSFEGDPFMDTGWIRNNIKCSGYAYSNTKTYNSLYVHETDPRYSEDLEPIWGTWGILINTISGIGNTANPHHPVNN